MCCRHISATWQIWVPRSGAFIKSQAVYDEKASKPLGELEYKRTVLIGVICAGEAVDFGDNLGSGLCPCWNQRSPSTDVTL